MLTGVSEEDGGVIMTVGGNHADQVSVDSEHQVASLDPVILTAQPQDIISSNGKSTNGDGWQIGVRFSDIVCVEY